MMALVAGAESEPFNHSTIQPFNSYTNHAGNVVSGDVVALDARTATISNAMESVALPLSIFPADEQRRIAADFVLSEAGGLRGGEINRPLAQARGERPLLQGGERAVLRGVRSRP